jgi:hypothetical protein
MKDGEIAGRVAGWIVAGMEATIAPDLSHPLFFSLNEDEGVEISIVGFYQGDSSQDPLYGLELKELIACVRGIVGIGEDKIIVKATSRELGDHPGVMAALFHSRQSNVEKYDPFTGRFSSSPANEGIDAGEFVRGVRESADSLFRAGSAARLVRLRRREVEVYVLHARNDQETFRDKTSLYARGDAIVVLVSPEKERAERTLTRRIALGLASSLTGVPEVPEDKRWTRLEYYSNTSRVPGLLPEWVAKVAATNVVLFELHRSMAAARKGFQIVAAANENDFVLDEFVQALSDISSHLSTGDWNSARRLVRDLKAPVRHFVSVVSRDAQAKKHCEVKALVISSEQKKRFILVYAFCAMVLSAAAAAGYRAIRSGRFQNHRSTVSHIFQRNKLD